MAIGNNNNTCGGEKGMRGWPFSPVSTRAQNHFGGRGQLGQEGVTQNNNNNDDDDAHLEEVQCTWRRRSSAYRRNSGRQLTTCLRAL
uniref:Uncharacterized protein n=1 Tax=Physcomitrium patens TaxID=3218 RepID=A0A2K1JBD4_PHYPA|nr:hypothetical protein PHYPA_019131 [Physcomitrium patens]